jgi:hypothetical protein
MVFKGRPHWSGSDRTSTTRIPGTALSLVRVAATPTSRKMRLNSLPTLAQPDSRRPWGSHQRRCRGGGSKASPEAKELQAKRPASKPARAVASNIVILLGAGREQDEGDRRKES